jgi:hypothetical protein
MARTLSWIGRIHTIAQTVAGSARSHYSSKEIEHLFQIQPRSAQNLMAALPTVPVGRARLVEREALSSFLEQLEQADAPAQVYAALREGKGGTVRRKLRTLVLQDVDANLDTLPSTIHLSLGELRVTFASVEQLAEALMHLASVLDKQLDEFAAQYEPLSTPTPDEQAEIEAERAAAEYFRNWGNATVRECDTHTLPSPLPDQDARSRSDSR